MEHMNDECSCEGKYCPRCQSVKCHGCFSRNKKSGKLYAYCRPCHNQRVRDWNKQNPEKLKAISERHRNNNPESVKEANRKYKLAHQEKYASLRRRWRENNPEKIKEYRRNWKEKHADEIKIYRRQWRQQNPEYQAQWWERTKDERRIYRLNYRKANYAKIVQQRRIRDARRRERERSAEGSFSKKEWERLKAQYNQSCLCCGRSDVDLVVDHIVPLSKGGSNFISNIQPLCNNCNLKKGTKTIDFRPKRT